MGLSIQEANRFSLENECISHRGGGGRETGCGASHGSRPQSAPDVHRPPARGCCLAPGPYRRTSQAKEGNRLVKRCKGESQEGGSPLTADLVLSLQGQATNQAGLGTEPRRKTLPARPSLQGTVNMGKQEGAAGNP